MDDRDRRPDPRAGLLLVSSFTGRINGALIIVLAIDVALIALLLDGARAAPGSEPLLGAILAPMALLGASLVAAVRGLLPRPSRVAPARDAEDLSDELRERSQRFLRKWSALKGAGLLLACALVWRFVAIRLP